MWKGLRMMEVGQEIHLLEERYYRGKISAMQIHMYHLKPETHSHETKTEVLFTFISMILVQPGRERTLMQYELPFCSF